MMMNIIRNYRFYRSLFCNFLHAKDHWEVIEALKCVLLAGVSLNRAFRQLVSRKSLESFVLSGWGSMRQPYIESATALWDIRYTFKHSNRQQYHFKMRYHKTMLEICI